jgi:hypothetical protein
MSSWQKWGLVASDHPFDMYEGPLLPDVAAPGEYPVTMLLYKRPLKAWCQNAAELCDQVRRTVYHELGPRLGFSDEGMSDELRGGVGTLWPAEARTAQAPQHLRRAEHDLAAAFVEGSYPNGALDAILATADRALWPLLLGQREDPQAVAHHEIPNLPAQAARHAPLFRKFRPLLRLGQIALDMGEPRAPPPVESARPKTAQELPPRGGKL